MKVNIYSPFLCDKNNDFLTVIAFQNQSCDISTLQCLHGLNIK